MTDLEILCDVMYDRFRRNVDVIAIILVVLLVISVGMSLRLRQEIRRADAMESIMTPEQLEVLRSME